MSHHAVLNCEIQALNADDVKKLINAGAQQIHLAWNISSDEFFNLAGIFSDEGMQIVKKGADFFLEQRERRDAGYDETRK